VEAICQFQLLPTEDSPVRLPSRLHERLNATYPGTPQVRQEVQPDVRGGVSEDGIPEVQAKYKLTQKILLRSEDGTRFVATSPNELSVHTLPPYDGWDAFRTRIADVLRIFGEEGTTRLASRVAVRYINRISLPRYDIPLEAYFKRAPEYPEELPVVGLTRFFSRIECEYKDEPIRLTMMFADVHPKPVDSPAVVLDLEVAWESQGQGLDVTVALPIIENLKEKLSVAFEKSLTDEARKLFDAD
jgi:uncharacterized protein (TIGR04255 family)